MNPRYGKDAPQGKTRRSSSALKPKREVGTLGSVAGPAEKKKPARPGMRPPVERQRVAMTPDVKRWSTVSWILMAVVVASATAALLLARAEQRSLASLAIGVEVSAFVASVWVMFGPLRKARAAGLEAAKKQKGGKSSKSEAGASKKSKKENDEA